MTTVILALAVPGLLAVVYLGLRRAQTTPLARSLAHARGDTRGIALQTVIIIVVLLAIAGAVAGVLLTRGTEATNQLEQSNVVREAVEYGGSKAVCEAAGFKWRSAGTDVSGTTAALTDDKCHE